MTFVNKVRVTFTTYKESTSTGRNWKVYYNTSGQACNDTDPAMGTEFYATGELPGRAYKEYTYTFDLNGDYNICFFWYRK